MRDTPASSVDSTTGTPAREIGGQGVLLAADAKDEVIAGEADLDNNRPRAHLGEQPLRVAFEGNRDAVADAAGAGDFDRLTNMKAEVGGGTRPSQSSPACSATGTSLARKRMISIWRV